jgi:hypothetical protein
LLQNLIFLKPLQDSVFNRDIAPPTPYKTMCFGSSERRVYDELERALLMNALLAKERKLINEIKRLELEG